jgi:FlaA1/EpsC-like NDP-sugar epimerase
MNLGKKTVLITGGTGSIGRSLVKRCLKEDVREVLVLSRDEIKQFSLLREINDARLKAFIVDVRDTNALERTFNLVEKVDIIFHAAAMKHVIVANDNPVEATFTNVVGTQNIIDMAVKFEVSKSILISTDKVIQPINVMGATKLIAERIFLNAAKLSQKQTFSIVRFGNVANSRGSVIPLFLDSVLMGRELIITDPNVCRFIMKIEEAVDLIVKASRLAVGGEIFVLKMSSFKLKELLEVITKRIAPRLGVKASKISSREIGLMKGEKLYEDLFFPDEIKQVFDLGELYVITDSKNFPHHKKYHSNTLAKLISVSSNKAPRLSSEELEDICMEYLNRRATMEE